MRSNLVFRRRPLAAGPTSCGHFDLLPLEIVFHIFNELDLSEIGMVALTSEGMRLKIAQWMTSRRCLIRVLEPPEAFPLLKHTSLLNIEDKDFVWLSLSKSKLSSYAVLCKRVTSLYTTKERIAFAFKSFQEALAKQEECTTEDQNKVVESKDWMLFGSAMKFFTLLHTFIRGWDETEFPGLLHAINKKFQLSKMIEKCLLLTEDRKAACLSSEMNLRLLTRCLTWELAGKDYGHRAAWIVAVLKFLVGNCPKKQASFFLLSFGQSCQDSESHYVDTGLLSHRQRIILNEMNNHTDWEVYTDTIADDYSEGKEMFFCLAQAICSCMNANKIWKKLYMVEVLDNLFVLPKPWPIDNVAGFLLFCSEPLIIHYVTHKLDTGKAKHFGFAIQLIVKMIITSFKFDNELNSSRGIGKVFDTICCHPLGDRKSKFFQDMLMCMVMELDNEDNDETEIDYILLRFTVHIAHRRFILNPSPVTIKLVNNHETSTPKANTTTRYDDDSDTELMEE